MMSCAVEEVSPIGRFCSRIMHTPESSVLSLSSNNSSSSSSSSSSSLDAVLDELNDIHNKYFDVVSVSIIFYINHVVVFACSKSMFLLCAIEQ